METIEVESVNSAVVNDIEIYDKQDELIAKADKVTVFVNLWGYNNTIAFSRNK